MSLIFTTLYFSGPCVVSFWRLVWSFHDLFLDGPIFDRADLTFSNVWAIFVGLTGTFLLDIFHHNISSWAASLTRLRLSLLSKLFSIMWGVLDVTYWKGAWDGMNLWLGTDILVPTITLLLGIITSVLLGSVKTGICAPVR